MEQGTTLVTVAEACVAPTHKSTLQNRSFYYLGTLKVPLDGESKRKVNVALVWCSELTCCTSMPITALVISKDKAAGLPGPAVKALGAITLSKNATEHILTLAKYVQMVKGKQKPPPRRYRGLGRVPRNGWADLQSTVCSVGGRGRERLCH